MGLGLALGLGLGLGLALGLGLGPELEAEVEAWRAHVGARAEARCARLAQRAALRVEQGRVHAARHDVVRQVARTVDEEDEALAPMARGRGHGRLVAAPRGLGHAEVVQVVDGRGAVLLGRSAGRGRGGLGLGLGLGIG